MKRIILALICAASMTSMEAMQFRRLLMKEQARDEPALILWSIVSTIRVRVKL